LEWPVRHYGGTRFEGLHILADLFDNAGELIPEHRWQPRLEADPSPVALPQVPVRAADAAGSTRTTAPSGGHLGSGHSLTTIGFSDLFHHHCFHIVYLLLAKIGHRAALAESVTLMTTVKNRLQEAGAKVRENNSLLFPNRGKEIGQMAAKM
jgi:hypothetical protein